MSDCCDSAVHFCLTLGEARDIKVTFLDEDGLENMTGLTATFVAEGVGGTRLEKTGTIVGSVGTFSIEASDYSTTKLRATMLGTTRQRAAYRFAVWVQGVSVRDAQVRGTFDVCDVPQLS